MVQPELATALVHAKLDAYRGLVGIAACQTSGTHPGHTIQVKDEPGLRELLKSSTEELAGLDWVTDDEEFERLCLEAEIDFAEVVRPPSRQKPTSQKDLRSKELGDLGELLALLHVLMHFEADPRTTMAKNAIKLYEQVSEPGIDVLCLFLDLESIEQQRLLPTDRVMIVESKVRVDASYATMATDAGEYFDTLTPHQWQRELRLAQASLIARGATAASRRVKYFFPIYPTNDVIRRLAFLTSNTALDEPIDISGLDGSDSCEAAILSIDVDSYRDEVFAYRRADD